MNHKKQWHKVFIVCLIWIPKGMGEAKGSLTSLIVAAAQHLQHPLSSLLPYPSNALLSLAPMAGQGSPEPPLLWQGRDLEGPS